ncbi:MAG TPA: hypothetical protein VFS58_14470 [Steroidobacteraceae bacterium]|nr:hypothetical protein [Steroidobacteraceae bacterium]
MQHSLCGALSQRNQFHRGHHPILDQGPGMGLQYRQVERGEAHLRDAAYPLEHRRFIGHPAGIDRGAGGASPFKMDKAR